MNNGFYNFPSTDKSTGLSIDTGSFAITGSNRFSGSQTITGSLSQGTETIASGLFSHAEGRKTTSSADYSHAEGNRTKALETGSHAEGNRTIASGQYSHAEGASTIALGQYSHAEGSETITSGSYSHAEGNETIAVGDSSHAEGFRTIASGSYQHVQGQYNLSSSAQSAFIIGNGTAEGSRSNLVFASGSTFQVTGSVIATQGFTGSLFGTASFVTSASFAVSSSRAVTSSFAISSSFAATASFALNAGTTINTGSFVTTSSFNAFTSSYNTGSFTGSFTGSLLGSASFAISGGNQNLQQVTNAGSSSTNTITLNPIVNTNGLNINTTFDESITGFPTALKILQTGEGDGIDINTPNGTPLKITSGNGSAIQINNSETGIYIVDPETGLLIQDTGNLDTGISMNLTNTAKGLTISSTTSATGNFIELKKNGVDKLVVNQDGAVTATSFTGSLFGTSSFAETASFLNTLNQNLTFNGNLTLNGTASISYLNVQYESASVIYSSGSNIFGDATNDTQTLIGTVLVSGSQQITGSLTISGSTTVAGNIVPSANVTYDLGSSTNNFLRVRAQNVVSNYGSLSIAVQHPNGATEVARFNNNTGNLALQPSGSTFVDAGYRLQVSGSTSGSLNVNGFSNFTGTISSSIQPANNPSASLMVIGGTTIQSSSILNSSAVVINPIMSASANSQVLVGLDINPTFNTGSFTGLNTFALKVNGPVTFNTSQIGSAYNRGLRLVSTTGFNEIFFNVNGNSGNDDGQFAFGVQNTTNGYAYFYNRMNGHILFGTNNTTKMQLFNTGNLTLQNAGAFNDNGYRLQVSGSTSGSLYTDGFVNHTGTISSSVAPANNPSASLMVIGGTTIQSASILNSSAVLINPIMSSSITGQTLVALDLQPTFTASIGTPIKVGMRVNADLGQNDYSIRLGSTTNNYGVISSTGPILLQAQNNTVFSATTVSTDIIGRGTTSNINFFQSYGGNIYGRFQNTTGNFLLQSGSSTMFTDDGVNRLQVSGSARITNGLTLTGSLPTPLLVERTTNGNSNVQYKNSGISFFTGVTQFNSFAIGNINNDLGTNAQLSIFPTTGNVVIQNGGTPVDTGYRLDVSGSARITNGLTVTGSTTSTQGFIKPGAGSQYLLADGTTTSSTGGSPFPYIGNAQITGSLNVSGSITGSLFGTASFSSTASFASNGGVTSIVAGTNITVSSATGAVTINSTGGGGGTSLGVIQAFSVGLQNIF